MITRRRLLTGLAGLAAGVFSTRHATASESETQESENLESEITDSEELRFPGDPTDHNVVYQFNKAHEKYHDGVLFSVGEMVRKYNDNITIVVTAFGAGIHILAKQPERAVSKKNMLSVKSLASYGVKFHACGNTLKTLGWDKDDLYDFVEIIPVGAADLLELQEQGYAYISL